MLKIKRHVLSKDEVVESLEYLVDRKTKYYIYSYKIRRGRKWITLLRFDNIDGLPHVDMYDENGNYMESREYQPRSFEDVVKIIRTFRKNIIAVDITSL